MKSVKVSEMKNGERAWMPGTGELPGLSISNGRVVQMDVDHRGGKTRRVLGNVCYFDSDGYIRGVCNNDDNYPVLVMDTIVARR